MKVYFIGLFMLLGFSNLLAGNEKTKEDKNSTNLIQGRISDSESGEAIAGARIFISEQNKEYFTDMEGNFKIVLPANSTSKINIGSLGYESAEIITNTSTFSLSVKLKSRD